jgi:hypothetical protein
MFAVVLIDNMHDRLILKGSKYNSISPTNIFTYMSF